MEYKILEENVEPRDAKLEKLGVVVTFTFNDIERHEASLQKILKELAGTRDYEVAKIKNIEANHLFVLNMSEQDLFTAHMYQESQAIVKVSSPKIAEIEKQLQDYADEKAEIIKQIPSLATPVVPIEGSAVVTESIVSPIQSGDLQG